MGLGIRGWRRVGLGICKVGGVGSRSNHAPWILFSAVRTISLKCTVLKYSMCVREDICLHPHQSAFTLQYTLQTCCVNA